MNRYVLPVFLSAFLLFQVQPLLGRSILPWFGGTPGVWTTCMLFFQVMLLLGYAYADLLARWKLKAQTVVHLLLLLAAALLLPILPDPRWQPTGETWPIVQILTLLAVTAGVPLLVLSATGPLLQNWYSRTGAGQSPYRLYAISNTGSLVALLSYPTVFERLLTVPTQAWVWSVGYLIFALGCGYCAVRLRQSSAAAPSGVEPLHAGSSWPSPAGPPIEPRPAPRIAFARRAQRALLPIEPAPATPTNVVFWIALPTCSCALLLAATNQICLDVAVEPLLWIVPLSLYLITFIVCFDNPRWYVRQWCVPLLATALASATAVLFLAAEAPLVLQVVVISFALFAACMALHGELVHLKPEPRRLTSFYLCIAAGGALGGVLVGILAPLLLPALWEYHLALAATWGLVSAAVARRHPWRRLRRQGNPRWRTAAGAEAAMAAAGIVLAALLVWHALPDRHQALASGRNFFGVVRVIELRDAAGNVTARSLLHGRIEHGRQPADDPDGRARTTYFGPESGVGIAVENHPRRQEGESLNVGVVGLGVGTIAAHAQPGDRVRFYEINPLVVDMAERYFTYLSGARERGVKVDVVVGDGRLQLERIGLHDPADRYDVLVIDAFSGDAVPIHLLTEECFDLYLRRLQPDGLLVVQVSNRFVELLPVVRGAAERRGMTPLRICTQEDLRQVVFRSEWVVATGNRAFLESPKVAAAAADWPASARRHIVWTDDFHSLLDVLR